MSNLGYPQDDQSNYSYSYDGKTFKDDYGWEFLLALAVSIFLVLATIALIGISWVIGWTFNPMTHFYQVIGFGSLVGEVSLWFETICISIFLVVYCTILWNWPEPSLTK